MNLTLDDLREQARQAEKATWEAREAVHKDGYRDPILRLAWSNQLAKFVFATDTFEVALQFGLNAAMLFKLSQGNIDPRLPAG